MSISHRDLERAIKDLGLIIDAKAGKGGHRAIRDKDGNFITVLPFHGSAKTIQNSHVKGLGRHFKRVLGDAFDEDAWVGEVIGRPQRKAGA
jgi:predicted RNA binding protein YcfA (HicA-like mRNA interferase family)